MSLTRESVFEAAQGVLGSFGLSTEMLAESHSFFGSDIWTSWVQVTGTGQWVVLMTCSSDLVVKIAAAMFEMEQDEISDDLVVDAVGEMTNMISGQAKGLLDPAADMSTPSVKENEECEDIFPDAKALADVQLQCDGEVCKVMILEA